MKAANLYNIFRSKEMPRLVDISRKTGIHRSRLDTYKTGKSKISLCNAVKLNKAYPEIFIMKEIFPEYADIFK